MNSAIAEKTRMMQGTPPGRVAGAFAFLRMGLTFATTAMVTEWRQKAVEAAGAIAGPGGLVAAARRAAS